MLDGDENRNNLGQDSRPFKENCRLSTRERRSEGKGPGARAGRYTQGLPLVTPTRYGPWLTRHLAAQHGSPGCDGFALDARATFAHVSTGRRVRLAISLAADLSQGEPTPWDHGPGRSHPYTRNYAGNP